MAGVEVRLARVGEDQLNSRGSGLPSRTLGATRGPEPSLRRPLRLCAFAPLREIYVRLAGAVHIAHCQQAGLAGGLNRKVSHAEHALGQGLVDPHILHLRDLDIAREAAGAARDACSVNFQVSGPNDRVAS
jgi:hypothetical protein